MRIPSRIGLILIFWGQLLYLIWKIQNLSQDEPHFTTWIFSMSLIFLGLCCSAAKKELNYLLAAALLLVYIILSLNKLHDVQFGTDIASLTFLLTSIVITCYAISRQHKMHGNKALSRLWVVALIPTLSTIFLYTGWIFLLFPPLYIVVAAWLMLLLLIWIFSNVDLITPIITIITIIINTPYLLYLAVSIFTLFNPPRSETTTPESSVNISDLF
ncbi:MAG: hypothetical protein K2G89_01310 [Lachnospiraceae bacterium]|nr:hypothetical protein [Lachnospiraceae bacterium]